MMPTLSHVQGATDEPLLAMTIGAYFDEVVRSNFDREALVVPYQGIRWTWGELNQRVDSFACALLRAGLMPGDRVGIWSQNCWEWVVTQFATAKTGLILVNINPAYRAAELEYSLNKVGCKALILAPAFKSSDYLAMLSDVAPELAGSEPGQLAARRLPDLELVIRFSVERTAGMANFEALMIDPSEAELQALAAVGVKLQPDDPINIQFTSGTTGSPKGATLTHRNILNNGYFVGQALRLTPQDRVCIPVPLYHCFGMVIGNLATMTHAATMVFPGEVFEALAVLETLEAERCTCVHGVPTMFIALLEHAEFARFDLTSLRTGMMAGSPCPIEVMRRCIADMHMHEVSIGYGMTETSPISFQSALEDSLERRVSTVGRVQPHLEVKVVDEAGRTVPRGVKGELLTRGYSVMQGYWADEARAREAVDADGWMHTGDLATIDAGGYCNIVGRAKDMVIRGGENLFPREIEEFLYRHPKVQDVQVVGAPDVRYGEELCAFIVLRPGEAADAEEIRDFCRDRIAHFKIPRYVRFVDEFPLTVSGKVLKYVLREQIARELNIRAVETA